MTELIGIVAVVVVAWFAAGTIWNVRQGGALMRWMQSGLPVLGERTTVRWLGSTVVEMTIRDAKAPFARAAILVFLEPRDLLWWPLSRLRGRRDTLIVRAVLRGIPARELEAFDRRSWSGRDALRRLPREWSAREAGAAGGLALHFPEPACVALADALLARARRDGLAVRRLSVRRTEPHFQVHLALPDPGRPAREFFEALRTLGELALVGHDRLI